MTSPLGVIQADDRDCAKLRRMASNMSALVLLHGLGMSGTVWQELIPLLSDHHHVYAPTALGHRGGPAVQRRPVTMIDVVDAAEHYLDGRGLDRPHLVGNSVGGYMAIELARRGRAATVCALSPAGFWSAGDALHTEAFKVVDKNSASRRLRPLAPLLVKSATARRLGIRDLACHGDRLSPAQFLEMYDDGLASSVVAEDLSADDWQIQPLNPLPCPVTIAWSEKDAFLPLVKYCKNAQECLPQATFTVLPDVGHAPMIDNPELVARTILGVTGTATN
jgi:pimeloyl-ACP methyl ester carboxylesterase